jgi:hypothetical protein
LLYSRPSKHATTGSFSGSFDNAQYCHLAMAWEFLSGVGDFALVLTSSWRLGILPPSLNGGMLMCKDYIVVTNPTFMNPQLKDQIESKEVLVVHPFKKIDESNSISFAIKYYEKRLVRSTYVRQCEVYSNSTYFPIFTADRELNKKTKLNYFQPFQYIDQQA